MRFTDSTLNRLQFHNKATYELQGDQIIKNAYIFGKLAISAMVLQPEIIS